MGTLDWAVDLANELFVEFGKSMTFFRETEDLPLDESKPWIADGLYPNPPKEYVVTAMTVPYEEKHIDGTLILRGDLKGYLAAKGLDYTPQAGDYAKINGQTWKVIGVTILEPNNDRILYEIQMRA